MELEQTRSCAGPGSASDDRRAHLVRRMRRAAVCFFILLGAIAPQSGRAQVNLPNGDYVEATEDLRVKVLGGAVAVHRTWMNGRWYFNPYWADLRFVRDGIGEGIKAIDRAGTIYERKGMTSTAYVFDKRLTIAPTEDGGYRWSNRAGDWIVYDGAGRIVTYGNRYDVRVNFIRDASGRLTEVRDHAGTVALSLSYTHEYVTRVRDGAGREVRYAFEPATGPDARLVEVIDVLGGRTRYTYDGGGQLTGRTDPAGHTVQVFYAQPSPAAAPAMPGLVHPAAEAPGVGTSGYVARDAGLARVGRHTDAAGHATVYNYAYDSTAQVYTTTLTHPDGRAEVLKHDRNGVLIQRSVDGATLLSAKVSTPSGMQTTTTMLSTDARGQTTTTQYNLERKIIRIGYPDGSGIARGYEPRWGFIETRTDEMGGLTRYAYDAAGSLVRRTEAAGRPEQRVTTWAYDTAGQAVRQTVHARPDGADDPADAITRYAYDSAGNLTEQTDPAGRVHRYAYAVDGQPVAYTDPAGQVWSTGYDAAGHPTRRTDPLGQSSSFAYDAAGQVSAMTDPAGGAWQLGRDPRGLVTRLTDPLLGPVQAGYDARGRITSTTNADGDAVQRSYDTQGRLQSITDPAGNVTRREYGSAADGLAGLLKTVVYPTYREDYRYDPRNRPVQIIRILGNGTRADTATTTPVKHTILIEYDAAGRIVRITDPAGRITRSAYDALGRLIRSTDALGNQTEYAWDTRDNLVALTDANGHTHRYAYDLADRLLTETRPLGGTATMTYDARGLPSTRTDAAGNVRRYTYDDAGRLVQETRTPPLGAVAAVQVLSYGYDAAGRLIDAALAEAGQPVSRLHITRDAKGRKTEEAMTYGSGATAFTVRIASAWSAADRKLSTTWPGGVGQSAAYAQGRLEGLTLPGGQSLTWSDWRWNQPRTAQGSGYSASLTYDPLQRPSAIAVRGEPGGTALMTWQGTYDAAGNLVERSDETGLTTYAYDALDRLTSAIPPLGSALPAESYAWDPVHNRTASGHQPGAWTYDADNRLTQWGQGADLTTLTYTPDGQQASQGRGAQTRAFGYDAGQRLARIEDNGVQTAKYVYDALGRRIGKTVSGRTTWYVYGDEGLFGEMDEGGKLIRAYGYAPDSVWGTQPLWQADIAGDAANAANWRLAMLHTDHLGTPQSASDAAGQRVWKAQAESFGKTVPDPTNTITMNLRFPGQYFDAESGMHYNGFRDYDSAIGRYVEEDPIGLQGGINLYGYTEANPLGLLDPYGLASKLGKCGSQILGTRSDITYVEKRTLLYFQYLIGLEPTGRPSLGVDLDPRHPRRVPIKPEFEFTFIYYLVKYFEYEKLRHTDIYQRLLTWCIVEEIGKCGEKFERNDYGEMELKILSTDEFVSSQMRIERDVLWRSPAFGL